MKLEAQDGKLREADCANTVGIFRILQFFSVLGEAATTEIARTQDAQGIRENKVAAGNGGIIAGDARVKLEIETGEPESMSENYLTEPES